MEKDDFVRFLKNIWPKIYRITNGLFFTFLRLFKNFIKSALDEIRA